LIASGQPAEIFPDGALELKDQFSVEHPDEINRRLVQAGFSPSQLLVEEEELEQYFLRLVGLNGGGN
jgi:ABC-2 type transport system ATP-binding protein